MANFRIGKLYLRANPINVYEICINFFNRVVRSGVGATGSLKVNKEEEKKAVKKANTQISSLISELWRPENHAPILILTASIAESSVS